MAELQHAGGQTGSSTTADSEPDPPNVHHHAAAARDSISQELQQASKRDIYNTRNRYIPRRALLDILTRERVVELLLIFLPNDAEHDAPESNAKIHKVAEYVSPSRCGCADDMCTGARMLFAALILMAKESLIKKFSEATDPTICDSNPQFETMAREFKKNGLLPQQFGMLTEDFELFCHMSWRLRSPILYELPARTQGIANDGGSEDVPWLEYDDEITLPWTESERVKKYNASVEEDGGGPVEGEFSFVEKIRIHPDHHRLHRLNSIEPTETHFALKIFEKTDVPSFTKVRFQREFEAMQAVGEHDQIVRLLAAFKYRDRFHLLFPWAQSGSLQDLWRNNDAQEVVWYSPDWLVSQCSGIAEALCAIHKPPGRQSRDDDANIPTTAPQFIHGDIKSENILCFGPTTATRGPQLKVADFGVAHPADDENSSVPIMTFRPPEYDYKYDVSVKSDIWCLGCLYLDFITWALAGFKAADEFSNHRLQEKHELEGYELDDEDTYFKLKADNYPWYKFKGFPFSKGVVKKRVTKNEHRRIERPAIWYGRLPRVNAVLKGTVTQHIKKLRANTRCDQKLDAFLTFIENRMLVVNPDKRAGSEEVRNFLQRSNSNGTVPPHITGVP